MIYNLVRKGVERYVPPTWAGGTDAEIIEALDKHYNNEIDLTKYWNVGDIRTVKLSSFYYCESTSPTSKHASQNVEFVLLGTGSKELVTPINGHTNCVFVVGQKDCLKEKDYFEGIGSTWYGSYRRDWCNTNYRNAIPSSIRGIFKQFKTVTARKLSAWELATTNDYFALPASKEMGHTTYSVSIENNALTKFSYYSTNALRTKKAGTSYTAYWTRSSVNDSYTNGNICGVTTSGTGTNFSVGETEYGLAPFGVI